PLPRFLRSSSLVLHIFAPLRRLGTWSRCAAVSPARRVAPTSGFHLGVLLLRRGQPSFGSALAPPNPERVYAEEEDEGDEGPDEGRGNALPNDGWPRRSS